MYECRLINVRNYQYHSFIRLSHKSKKYKWPPMGKSMVLSTHLTNPDSSIQRNKLCRLTWVCPGGDDSWIGGDWRAHQGGGVRVGTQHRAQVADHLRVGTRSTGRTQRDKPRKVLSSQCLGTDHNNNNPQLLWGQTTTMITQLLWGQTTTMTMHSTNAGHKPLQQQPTDTI